MTQIHRQATKPKEKVKLENLVQNPAPIRSPSDCSSSNMRLISCDSARKPHLIAGYGKLEILLSGKEYCDPILVNNFAPLKPQFRFKCL